MSSKLPYYPYYVDDFDDDPNVRAMNLAEVGLYQLALNEAWKQGSIPADPKELAMMIRRKPAEVCRAWPKVQTCWIANCLPGRLVNPRQERERSLAEERANIASSASRKRWESTKVVDSSICSNDAIASESGSPSSSASLSSSESSLGVRVLYDNFLRRFSRHRGFKKPNKNLRERGEQRWQRIEITDAELDAAMDGFFDSEWGRQQNYPFLGFLKDPHSWIADEIIPLLVPSVDNPVATQAVAVTCQIFEQYFEVGKLAGKALGQYEREQAWPLWEPLTQEQRLATGRDYARICQSTKTEFIPLPANHLRQKPWTREVVERVLPVPKRELSKHEQALEIGRRMGLR